MRKTTKDIKKKNRKARRENEDLLSAGQGEEGAYFMLCHVSASSGESGNAVKMNDPLGGWGKDRFPREALCSSFGSAAVGKVVCFLEGLIDGGGRKSVGNSSEDCFRGLPFSSPRCALRATEDRGLEDVRRGGKGKGGLLGQIP